MAPVSSVLYTWFILVLVVVGLAVARLSLTIPFRCMFLMFPNFRPFSVRWTVLFRGLRMLAPSTTAM